MGRVARGVAEAVAALVGRRPLARTPPIIVGATYWTVNGVNVFSANLVRGLNRLGGDAHVLLTEEDTDLVTVRERQLPRADDIRFETLGLARSDGWGRHWGRMVRYLSERAPCVYIPNSDWRHSCVCPLLPNDVTIVGVVHSDDPLHYDHVRRIGQTWNAVVCVSQAVAQRTAELCPALADRIITIPIGARIPDVPPGKSEHPDRLRLIYHGILKQHQKRVLDLPRIVQAAVDRGVPVEMTIVGAGPDEAELRAAAAPLVERGFIRFHGVVAPDDVGGLLAQHEVSVLASEFEGLPNALIEAMGQGCVPLVTRMTSGVPELVHDEDNGFLVPIGDAAAFAERLHQLWSQPERRRQLSANAFRTVATPPYRVEDMVESYASVFERARADAAAGRFVRERGDLAHPPVQVAGVSLFPVALGYHEPGVGAFPNEDDALDYQQEMRRLREHVRGTHPAHDRAPAEAPIEGMKVFIASPVWTDNGVNLWAEDLARGLRGAGLDARLLLTEEATELVRIPGPRLARPTDVPVDNLQLAGQHDGWGARWGAMTRLLERATPCIYIPNFDWRHSCITPLLPPEVIVVGTVHDPSALYFEHARRVGDSWNALVGTNGPAVRLLRREMPELEKRLSVISHGLAIPAAPVATGTAGGSVMTIVDAAHVAHLRHVVASIVVSGAPTVVVLTGDADSASDTFRQAGAAVLVRPNRQEWLEVCRRSTIVVVATDPDSRSERMTVEAMAHGCVRVSVATGEHGPKGMRLDDETGLPAPTGVDDAGRWVAQLLAEEGQRRELGLRAHAVAAEGRYTLEQMIAAYLQLFRRLRGDVERGVVPHRSGRIEPPPPSVEGADILPISLAHETARGRFPSEVEEQRFEAERAARP